MPEYLAPGVYVEETSFRAKSIEGVGTSTTAFVGPTLKGPHNTSNTAEKPELLTSFNDFERLYGGLADLGLSGGAPATNYLAHAVLAYFNEGGSRLYVSRVVSATATAATVAVIDNATASEDVTINARNRGSGGNGRVTVREDAVAASVASMASAPVGSLLRTTAANVTSHHVKVGSGWRPATDTSQAAADPATLAGNLPRLVTVAVATRDASGNEGAWEGLGLHASHPRYLGHLLAAQPGRRADHLQNAYAIAIGGTVTADELIAGLMSGAVANAAGQLERSWVVAGGSDGAAPTQAEYQLALQEIAALEDVAIVAAPGSSAYADGAAIAGSLIGHAEGRRAYRIAVLDTAPNQTPGQVRTFRGTLDSRYAALYYPWVVVGNPNARPGRSDIPAEIALPPSGHVCGIYARNDVQRGVHKAPANEVVRSALRFEVDVNFAQQEVLNPIGVNCLRLLSGRGYRVWGARLISSDPEWKYVSDRRYFNYLEASIDRSTQWAVFEPNGERLWANVRQSVADFLYNEWRGGALLGASIDEAFFVRCDRSTMTQNDLDNGRLICLIGVAIVKPAEFVVFRIGQKTAEARA
jgi:phage tail sheath protein FI